MRTDNVIVTAGFVTIGTTTLKDMLPPERGGTGQGFQPEHLLGGMAATTLLLLLGNGAPELAKAFAIMMGTVSFLYSGATILETFFTGPQYKEPKRKKGAKR